ncbi:hypothetical protein [Paenibacillus sp. GCM10028914]|uniref:hypothetical protein n=1 Tax=Paenibacillus sp. GCM10028914 TaxID=3273416 RepID=UPI00360CA85C
MNRKQLIMVVMVVVLAACGNNTADVTNSTIEDKQSELEVESRDTTTPETVEVFTEPFKEGIFVDFAKYKEAVKEEQILEVLKSNFESLITDNEEQFRNSFLTEKNADPNMFWFESPDQFQFIEIESIEHYPEKGNIHIYVIGNSQPPDGTISPMKMMYAFRKSDAGQWKIYTID